MDQVQKIIVGLIGEKLSGKDTAAKYIVGKYGAVAVGAGDTLAELLHILRLPNTRVNLTLLAEGLRSAFGQNVLQETLWRQIEDSEEPIQLIHGIRKPEELEDLRKHGGIALYITAPLEIRYQRLLSRRQKHDDGMQTLEQFKQEELLPAEMHIPALGKQADYTIDNTGDAESLQSQIDRIMNEVKSTIK